MVRPRYNSRPQRYSVSISDRDWSRSTYEEPGDPSRGLGSALPPGCRWLIGITVIVYVLQLLITRRATPEDFGWLRNVPAEALPDMVGLPRISLLQNLLELTPAKVLDGQLWRLVTYGFCHDRFNLLHILFNMLFLWWFGPRLETRFGTAEFVRFYLAALLVAGLAFMGLGLSFGSPVPVIGASGAILAVLMVYAMLFPHETILLFFIIPVRVVWLVVLYVIWDLHPLLLALGGDNPRTGVAYAAHLGGLIFGFLYWRFGWSFDLPLWARLRGLFRHRSRPIAPADPSPETPADAAEVDRVLDKISKHGLESLTADERRVLRRGYRVVGKRGDP